jgi:hypothetical protein
MKILLLFSLIVAWIAPALRADGIPCTQNGFYYAVCPTQPELTNRRMIDGSNLPPAPPNDPNLVVDGSKLPQRPPQHVHGAAAASKRTLSEHAAPAAATPAALVIRKNWRNYTMTDWMSISSIFLLALVVSVVFYLVNRTIQNERRARADEKSDPQPPEHAPFTRDSGLSSL